MSGSRNLIFVPLWRDKLKINTLNQIIATSLIILNKIKLITINQIFTTGYVAENN